MNETTISRVSLTRESRGTYVATNERGGTLRFGPGVDDGFSPVELLLAAVAGCSGIDLDYMTTRRADPLRFDATSEATYEKGEQGNLLRDFVVTFHLEFPEGEDGDRARARIEPALKTTRENTCTVSRTLEAGARVELRND
jgi:putative redox protein